MFSYNILELFQTQNICSYHLKYIYFCLGCLCLFFLLFFSLIFIISSQRNGRNSGCSMESGKPEYIESRTGQSKTACLGVYNISITICLPFQIIFVMSLPRRSARDLIFN